MAECSTPSAPGTYAAEEAVGRGEMRVSTGRDLATAPAGLWSDRSCGVTQESAALPHVQLRMSKASGAARQSTWFRLDWKPARDPPNVMATRPITLAHGRGLLVVVKKHVRSGRLYAQLSEHADDLAAVQRAVIHDVHHDLPGGKAGVTDEA